MAEDCSGWIEPLNLECLLVNNFAGSMEVFMLVIILFIAGMGAYFRMINMVILVMFGLFSIVMAQYFEGLYFLSILIAGLFISFSIARIVKR